LGKAARIAANDENRPLKDFAAPIAIGIQLGYIMPNVEVNNFKLKFALLNMLSQHVFNDLVHEDPNQHLTIFEKLYNTVKLMVLNPRSFNLGHFLFS
jgi:hypothetical protein